MSGSNPTRLFIETGRLVDHLSQATDALIGDLGLTTARWQVLGVAAQAATPATVSHIARIMGLARQSVQRVVNDLAREGFVELRRNPHHARAPLVVLTARGQGVYDAASQRRDPWARALTARIEDEELKTALKVVKALNRALISSASEASQA